VPYEKKRISLCTLFDDMGLLHDWRSHQMAIGAGIILCGLRRHDLRERQMMLKRVNTNDDELKVGDRFLCQVSVFEPNLIPGQNSGSKYYLRITAIRKTRWYFLCDVQYENEKLIEIEGLVSTTKEPRQGQDHRKFFVLRECDEKQKET
jgi:hypothetical protein